MKKTKPLTNKKMLKDLAMTYWWIQSITSNLIPNGEKELDLENKFAALQKMNRQFHIILAELFTKNGLDFDSFAESFAREQKEKIAGIHIKQP